MAVGATPGYRRPPMSWLVGDDEEQPGGNQLAAAALDAPLVPPTQQLLRGRVKAGTTRRHGCGVCRTCLFAPHSLVRRRVRVRACTALRRPRTLLLQP